MADTRIPIDEVEALVEGLSYQDKVRILANVLWEVFGDVDEAGGRFLFEGRSPDRLDVASMVAGLRAEFWPSASAEGEEDADGEG